jgi:hypothetical protein
LFGAEDVGEVSVGAEGEVVGAFAAFLGGELADGGICAVISVDRVAGFEEVVVGLGALDVGLVGALLLENCIALNLAK